MTVRATNEWKVGAFVAGGVVALVVVLFWLGAQRLDTETIQRVTYFDESVQGLEVGAPVKVRGVTIGKVIDIRLAPDHRLVEVLAEIRVDALVGVNAVGERSQVTKVAGNQSPEMRIVISAQGITGIKFLQADFFPPATPELELSFEPPPNYIPSAPSTLKSLEDAVRVLGESLPLAIEDVRALVTTVEERVTAFDTKRLSEAIVELANEMRQTLEGTAEAGLGADLKLLVGDLRRVAASLDHAVESVMGPEGAVERSAANFEALAGDIRSTVASLDQAIAGADVPATAASIRNAAGGADRVLFALEPAGGQLVETARDLRSALRKIEALADLLERDPGALLRGRAVPSDR